MSDRNTITNPNAVREYQEGMIIDTRMTGLSRPVRVVQVNDVEIFNTMDELLARLDRDIEEDAFFSLEQLVCSQCGNASDGGRYTCCAVAICHPCYTKGPATGDPCTLCKQSTGYMRVNERQSNQTNNTDR